MTIVHVPASMHLVFYGLVTPSQNEWQRMHWARRSKLRDTYCLLVRSRIRGGYLALHRFWTENPEKRTVRIVRYGLRTLDRGNLIGGCKALVDALVKEKVIVDDSPKWVDDLYAQKTVPKSDIRMEIWVAPALCAVYDESTFGVSQFRDHEGEEHARTTGSHRHTGQEKDQTQNRKKDR